ncbi:MAG: hypothetical protein HN509_14180 [Halobacteriovoraceae bacterium]|nr:hypothetical protein [Halobacteriovoraceae bacterium]
MERKVAYIGKDNRYFTSIKRELDDLYGDQDTFKFFEIWEEAEGSYKNFLKKILKENPAIIFIDYTYNTEDMIRLGSILRSLNDTKKIALVGLLNPLETAEKRKDFVTRIGQSGVLVNQIKMGGDPHDAVYDGYALAFPSTVKEPGFVTVKSKDGIPSKLGEIVRINSISPEDIVIETNIPFEVNEIISLNTHIPEDALESKQFIVEAIQQGNNYYNSLYRVKLRPCYLDLVEEVGAGDQLEQARVVDEKQKREAALKESAIPAFINWVRMASVESTSKDLKVLCVDREVSILDQVEQWIGEFDYCVRLQSCLEEEDPHIELYRPHIITFVMEEVPLPPEPDPAKPNEKIEPIDPLLYNSMESLQRLVDQLSSLGALQTVIVVFNAQGKSSQDLQTAFNYPKMVAHQEAFSYTTLLGLTDIYKSTNPNLFAATPGRFFIAKDSEYSNAIFWEPIKIFVINEVHIDFECERDLPLNATYILDQPTQMAVSTVAHKESSPYNNQDGMFYSLIHSMERESRKTLRSHLIKNKT